MRTVRLTSATRFNQDSSSVFLFSLRSFLSLTPPAGVAPVRAPAVFAALIIYHFVRVKPSAVLMFHGKNLNTR